MKRLAIWNAQSGKAALQESVLEKLHGLCDQVVMMDRETDLPETFARAVEQGCTEIVAGGGDGTVNAVVNAIMRIERDRRPRLAILPLGTANDFAGSLCIPDDPADALVLLDTDQTIPVDVVRIRSDGFTRYYANIAAGGNSVRVSEEMTEEMKQRWGAFCYIRGGMEILADLQSYRIEAECDQEQFSGQDTWAVLVANGKTNAGRIVVAPDASPIDGLLDVIIIRNGTAIDLVEMVASAVLGNYLDCEQVTHRQVKRLRLRSTPGMRFTIDGEVIDQQPVEFDIVEQAIPMLVGTQFLIDHQAELRESQRAINHAKPTQNA